MPSEVFVHFAFKVDGDGSYTLFEHDDLTVTLIQSGGSTTIAFKGNTASTSSIGLGDIDAEVDWNSILSTISGTELKIYLNESVIPIVGYMPNYSPSVTGDIVVGSVGLDVSNFVIGSGVIAMDEMQENYIYKDIVRNNGDLFFEV